MQHLGRLVEAVLGRRLAEQGGELARDLADLDTVLRPLGTRQARRDVAEVESHHLRIVDVARARDTEQALGPEIGLEGLDLVLGAAGALEVFDRAFVHRKEAHRRAVLGRHVGDGGAVRQGQGARSLAEELDELAHDFFLAQDFGHREDQIRRGAALAQAARQLEADHVRRQHVDGLAQHRRLGLDAAHAPAHHADAVDHRGVAVGTHQRIGIVHAIGRLEHAARQVLQVHLVHDAESGRDHAEGAEGLHAPLHELVALAVALELQLHVQVERVPGSVVIDHDGVIDHQVHRDQRFDRARPAPHPRRHAAHRRQVGQQRHAGKVLQHHARDHEGNLFGAIGVGIPVGHLPHMLGRDLVAVAVAQDRFQDDAHGNGQPVYLGKLPGKNRQRKELPALSRCGLEGLEGVGESVGHLNLRLFLLLRHFATIGLLPAAVTVPFSRPAGTAPPARLLCP